MIVGIDEAGRGPLAGCVVSCALHCKEDIDIPVRDSKSLTHAMREKFFRAFKDKAVFSLGIATSSEIDEHNILGATHLSFNRAISSLLTRRPRLKKALFIVDGNSFTTNLAINYKCIAKADTLIKEVAFASITAKLFRDHLMRIAHVVFPEWNFNQHKGYPTREHLALIKKHRLSSLHRKSFFPCTIHSTQ